MHIEPDLLSIGIEIQSSTHCAAQPHSEDFMPRGTDIGLPLNGGFRHDSLSRTGGVEVHVHHVFSALGVHRANALPLRKPVKMPSQVETPGSKDGDDGHHEYATKSEHNRALQQATKTTEARPRPSL